jgi:hypothetical protein
MPKVGIKHPDGTVTDIQTIPEHKMRGKPREAAVFREYDDRARDLGAEYAVVEFDGFPWEMDKKLSRPDRSEGLALEWDSEQKRPVAKQV